MHDMDKGCFVRSEMTSERLTKALIDPSSVFSNPGDVVNAEVSKERKIEILRRWEYDAKEMQVADEEGFPPREHGVALDAVLSALHCLGVGPDLEHAPPTKQGGV